MRTTDHAGIAARYADDVLSGAVPACAWVRKAARRHQDDLQRVREDAWPYRFDAACGARVARFVETLPHVKGEWARRGDLMQLEPWQSFLVVTLFGWVRKRDARRRFREAYLEVPRKNGKTQLAAAIALYMLTADGEHGAEIYAGASTERQAWEVFGVAREMVVRTTALQRKWQTQALARMIVASASGSKFEPLSSNPGDGSTPSCAVIDEFHEHDTPTLIDAMQTGMGSRTQPLTLITTTAGYNIAGPCYDKRDQVIKMLDGVIETDDLFGLIYTIDDGDDWADPSILAKANPNLGVSVDPEFLIAQQRQALASTTTQHRFQTKHLNRWVSVRSGWMDMPAWNAAVDATSEVEISKREGVECRFAIDLASKSDLCTCQRLYASPRADGRTMFHLFGVYWLPEETIEEPGPNSAMYRKWVQQSWLTATDGATIDFALITETILEDCRRANPVEVIYDPHTATRLAQDLMADGVTAVEFVQTPSAFGVPMDELTAALKDGRFKHDGNPITAWCMANVVARPVKKGLFAPMKAKPHLKIDGAVAAIMATARATIGKAPVPQREYQVFFVG